ncbi:hypothetical protein EW146_g4232 [Bondarzewia mesenterica]|uniref:HMG box domain-containing protein n=1 Tax=Bondarzewia mesenterica TaxID=1095465 RepID=A0A4S4M109_9AGAM|nr:hypothetical protein EW146_g4232 [Bondarzewia mesenterica]
MTFYRAGRRPSATVVGPGRAAFTFRAASLPCLHPTDSAWTLCAPLLWLTDCGLRDMPPAGGFESLKYKRNLPLRGPSGLVLLGGVTAVCVYGFYRLGKGNMEKRELQREKTWSRIHLIPLLLAEGDRDAYRRQQAAVGREREIMKDVKDWEVSHRGLERVDGRLTEAGPDRARIDFSIRQRREPAALLCTRSMRPSAGLRQLPRLALCQLCADSSHPESVPHLGTAMDPFRRPLSCLLLKFTTKAPCDHVLAPSRCHRPPCLYNASPPRFPLRHIPPTLPPSSHMHHFPSLSRPHPSASSPFVHPDDASMKDASPLISFDDDAFPRSIPNFDSDHMIFGPLDIDDPQRHDPSLPFSWDSINGFPSPASLPSFSASPASPCSQLDYSTPQDPSFSPNAFAAFAADMPSSLSDFDDSSRYISNWLVDEDFASLAPSSSPIAIPSFEGSAQAAASFVSYQDSPLFLAKAEPFSPPADHPALHPLSRSMDGTLSDAPVASISPPQISQPSWALDLWNPNRPVASPPPSLLHPPHSPLSSEDHYATQRQRSRRSSIPLAHVFQSSSAPSGVQSRTPSLARHYSRRAESAGLGDDPDATVRRKRKVELRPTPYDINDRPRTGETSPQKSHLKPPKLAPSAWQLYFTDWIQRHQASNTRKLNVAQAAKEAGIEYAQLSNAEKEPYKRRSQAMKEIREREYLAYMSSLTPEDIKRENTFRAAQRKAGKSRKGNIKDPNAPKKPLSAYFMFLQRIRSDPVLVKDVFGDETETTKQSVLAAGKWRSMTDDERKPFLAQAEQEKLEYESARKMYEDGTTGYGTSISFSVLPGNPFQTATIPLGSSRSAKAEASSSESESEGSMADDVADRYRA